MVGLCRAVSSWHFPSTECQALSFFSANGHSLWERRCCPPEAQEGRAPWRSGAQVCNQRPPIPAGRGRLLLGEQGVRSPCRMGLSAARAQGGGPAAISELSRLSDPSWVEFLLLSDDAHVSGLDQLSGPGARKRGVTSSCCLML